MPAQHFMPSGRSDERKRNLIERLSKHCWFPYYAAISSRNQKVTFNKKEKKRVLQYPWKSIAVASAPSGSDFFSATWLCRELFNVGPVDEVKTDISVDFS